MSHAIAYSENTIQSCY